MSLRAGCMDLYSAGSADERNPSRCDISAARSVGRAGFEVAGLGNTSGHSGRRDPRPAGQLPLRWRTLWLLTRVNLQESILASQVFLQEISPRLDFLDQ